ncbi:MAG: dTDP-4-dehydrorhamnose reductase [Eubacteriales bacterium]|nr:dTDP-4-dehydrorhamnose reductase [Eubacteriales bacterium]
MKVLVTGVKGQLGHDVVNELTRRNHEAVGVDIEEMDITDMASVDRVIKEIQPEAVIHCAAWTAVDLAEDYVDKVRLVNAAGTENIARVCRELDIKMMYISTDYVFNGQGTHFWEPDDLNREPLNVYGQTKYEGELAVENNLDKYFIVRIAWVFGVNGKNFIKTMLNLGKTHDKLTVVCDQIGSPTYTYDLARLLVDMIETDKYGRYHATNEGLCSWYEFACEIFRQAAAMGHTEYDAEHLTVEPVSASEYPSKAKRPSNSRMSKEKLTQNGFALLPSWQDAVRRYLTQISF